MKVLGNIMVDGETQILGVKKEGDLYQYVLGNEVVGFEVVGVFDPDVMADSLIVFRENTIENELSDQIRDEITQIVETAGKEEILKTEPEREQKENVFEEEMGDEEELPIEENDENIEEEKEEKEEQEEEKEEKTQQEDEEEQGEIIENTTGDIPIQGEIPMDQMITPTKTLGDIMEAEGKINREDKENGTLGIVYAEHLRNLQDENGKGLEGDSSKYDVVIIKEETGKDGKHIVEKLDLEQDRLSGTHPSDQNYQVNGREEVTKDTVDTRLQLDEEGEQTLGIKDGQMGEEEAFYSPGKTRTDNENLDIQLETRTSNHPIGGKTKDTQELSPNNTVGYRSVEDSNEEAKRHENDKGEPCKELQVEDIDGDPNTSNHNHIDDTVALLMENEQIADIFTEREVRGMVERAWDNDKDNRTLEEFQKDVERKIELDAENMQRQR